MFIELAELVVLDIRELLYLSTTAITALSLKISLKFLPKQIRKFLNSSVVKTLTLTEALEEEVEEAEEVVEAVEDMAVIEEMISLLNPALQMMIGEMPLRTTTMVEMTGHQVRRLKL
jgi:hypothetical protein